eukprot:Selendium_serpulae@DN3549_c0_g1_i2.p1
MGINNLSDAKQAAIDHPDADYVQINHATKEVLVCKGIGFEKATPNAQWTIAVKPGVIVKPEYDAKMNYGVRKCESGEDSDVGSLEEAEQRCRQIDCDFFSLNLNKGLLLPGPAPSSMQAWFCKGSVKETIAMSGFVLMKSKASEEEMPSGGRVIGKIPCGLEGPVAAKDGWDFAKWQPFITATTYQERLCWRPNCSKMTGFLASCNLLSADRDQQPVDVVDLQIIRLSTSKHSDSFCFGSTGFGGRDWVLRTIFRNSSAESFKGGLSPWMSPLSHSATPKTSSCVISMSVRTVDRNEAGLCRRLCPTDTQGSSSSPRRFDRHCKASQISSLALFAICSALA